MNTPTGIRGEKEETHETTMKVTGAVHFAMLMVILAICSAGSTTQSPSFSSALDETRSDSANAASDSSTKNETGACRMDCDVEGESYLPDMGRISKSVNDEYQELVNAVNKRFHDAKKPPPCQAECNYYGQLYCADESFRHIDQCNTCTCWEGGKVSCTVRYCSGPCDGPTCMYGMEGNITSYCTGESWLAKDGINLCVCDEDGIVHCTDDKKSESKRVMLRLVGS